MNEVETKIAELINDVIALNDKFAKVLNEYGDKMPKVANAALRSHGIDINLIRYRMLDEFPIIH